MSDASDSFKVWACDNMVYGPIDLPTLVEWVKDGRVVEDTWVHRPESNGWVRASELPGLRGLFTADGPGTTPSTKDRNGSEVDLDELRLFGVFAGLSYADLSQLVRFGEVESHPAGGLILKKGDPGDAIYFVLSGAIRARLMVGFEDVTLSRIRQGEFFGEMALFTQTLRTADIVAEEETRLMRLSSEAFLLLTRQLPGLACPILFNIARSMAGRMAETNQKFQRDVASGFVWR